MLVKRFHPDLFTTGSEAQFEAELRIRQINAAYGVLSNPQKRSAYDAKATSRGRLTLSRNRNTVRNAESRPYMGRSTGTCPCAMTVGEVPTIEANLQHLKMHCWHWSRLAELFRQPAPELLPTSPHTQRCLVLHLQSTTFVARS